jgi:hypothetical protein
MLAQVCGYRPGDFVHTFGDAHLYSNHFEQARLQLTRAARLADDATEPRGTRSVRLPFSRTSRSKATIRIRTSRPRWPSEPALAMPGTARAVGEGDDRADRCRCQKPAPSARTSNCSGSCLKTCGHFRETTSGKPVIMGRKTWESLPPAFRPLPNGTTSSSAAIRLTCRSGQRRRARSRRRFVSPATPARSSSSVAPSSIGRPAAGQSPVPDRSRREDAPATASFPDFRLPNGAKSRVARDGNACGACVRRLGDQSPAFDFVVYERR